MSASVGQESGGNSPDFDLNLAPIIDCFTVLIAFMLASASFLAIGVFEAGAAASSAAGNVAKPPSIRIDLELTAQKEVNLKVQGRLSLLKKLPAHDGGYDRAAVVAEIDSLKSKFPDTQGLVLNAADDVEYDQIIAMMEALKKHIGSVLLGGL